MSTLESRMQASREIELQHLPGYVSPELLQRRIEVNRLFDLAAAKAGVREAEIFRSAFPNDTQRMSDELLMFEREVSQCAPEAIEICQQLIAPKRTN